MPLGIVYELDTLSISLSLNNTKRRGRNTGITPLTQPSWVGSSNSLRVCKSDSAKLSPVATITVPLALTSAFLTTLFGVGWPAAKSPKRARHPTRTTKSIVRFVAQSLEPRLKPSWIWSRSGRNPCPKTGRQSAISWIGGIIKSGVPRQRWSMPTAATPRHHRSR